MNYPELQNKTFLALLIVVTLAFGWVLWPFSGAVFWGAILALLFAPFHRRLLRGMGQRRNLAALATLLLCLVIVIFPLVAITASLIQEGAAVYQRIRSGQLDFAAYFVQVINALPPWMTSLLDRFGLADLSGLRETLSAGAVRGSQAIATQALQIGQNAFSFLIDLGIMLYLLFFLLRDGAKLSVRIREAIPLSAEHKRHLFSKFTTVIRATVKGSIVVAIVQGLLGGIIFWVLGIQGALLWGVVMAFLSLLPAVGTALIWGPVAIYFLFTGAIWQGVILIGYGILVIGLVDNVLRPVLVGKDTQMPDYVVLISTLGGIALFGINGFVIGPVIAALFIAAWDLFATAKEEAGLPRP
jgi:predicted PurR-regulated permease PerM